MLFDTDKTPPKADPVKYGEFVYLFCCDDQLKDGSSVIGFYPVRVCDLPIIPGYWRELATRPGNIPDTERQSVFSTKVSPDTVPYEYYLFAKVEAGESLTRGVTACSLLAMT